MPLNKTPYNIEKPLGGGENASVYQAIERATGKKIALKVAKRGSERLVQQEGQLTQKIASKIPHVRRVVNIGQASTGEFYVAYEFMQQTLGKYIKERRKQNKPFSLSEAAEILTPIAQALDQLHHNYQLAHSDLKPDNILMGEEGTVRLADFGNATPFGTIAQQVSPFYMTPEQANNQPCQPASDVYGLALILYEMLTLSRPILGDNPVAMSIQVLKQKPIPIQNLRPDIPPRLAQNIMRGLQKAATARPKQPSALMAGFPPPKIKYGPPIARPPTMNKAQSTKKKSPPKWPLLALLALLLLLIFSGGGYLLGFFDPFLEEPTIAVEESAIEESSASEPIEPSVTSSPTVEEEEQDDDENEETEAEEATGEEEPTEENLTNGEATATRRPTATTTRRPTATNTALATATSSTALATATSSNSTALATATSSNSTALATATSTALPSFTPTLLVTPTSVPEITNTALNRDEAILLVDEATITVAPTFTIINSTPSSTIAPPTVPPPTTIPPTVVIPATVVLPTTILPTLPPPTKTATRAPANYDQAAELISPSKGEVIQSELVTFEWNWNGPRLAQGQQFRLHGFRDGEWLELSTSSNTTVQVTMRNKGNFETNWEWYVVVIDQTGQEISPRSSTESFGISLTN